MSETLPKTLPSCALAMLARAEWFSPDAGVISKARLAKANWVARVLSSPLFSGPDRIWAITVRKTIYVLMEDQYNPHMAPGLARLAHELKHVHQYERQGLLKFFARYILSYLAQGGYGKALPFEKEAYCFQEEVEKHLTLEFANNPGVNPCQEMIDPHTPNDAFVKITPQVSPFSKGEGAV